MRQWTIQAGRTDFSEVERAELYSGLENISNDWRQESSCRWKSSLWKLIWKELLVYTGMFMVISMVYR